MPVSSVRKELRDKIVQYDLIDDCLIGEQRIKYKKDKYLPRPNASDTSSENNARYDAYITRANFMNVAQQTLLGMRGQVFLRDPLVEVPALLEPVIVDATGGGVPMQQLAQQWVDKTLAHGRSGLYVDYPNMTDANGETLGASLEQVESGQARPTFKLVPAKDAINWRTKRRGAKLVLSLVVFREDYEEEDDGFEATVVKDQWRVLRLVDDVYVIEIYRDKSSTKPVERYIPKDAAGNTFDEIGFTFIGATNNEPTVDEPPLYSICSLNIGHYRNSADYEESVYQLGQPTFWFSGLTQKWIQDVFQDKPIPIGALGAIALPADGAAGLLQAEPNTLAKEAMDQKEAQMLALGAKLIEGSQTQRTATEADYDNISETSILSTIAKNVGAAIQWGLVYSCRFVGVTPPAQGQEGAVAYELNTEFDLVTLNPEERKTLLAEYQGGGITWTEWRDSLRRAGIASLSDEEAKAETEKEEGERMANAVKEAEGLAAASLLANPDANPAAE